MTTKAGKLTDSPVTIRVHPDLLLTADDLVHALAADPELSTEAGGANRSSVLRLALVRGLRVLRKELGGVTRRS